MMNYIQYGRIEEYRYVKLGDGKKLEVKVSVDERVTDWLPIKTQSNSFLVVHTPVRIGEQVVVFNPFGANKNGFVDRNLTYVDMPLPENADKDKYLALFEDGTEFMFDVKEKIISLDTSCDVKVTTSKTLAFNASDISFNASTITHNGETVVTKNLKVSQTISDVKGDLTNHNHAVEKHSVALPR